MKRIAGRTDPVETPTLERSAATTDAGPGPADVAEHRVLSAALWDGFQELDARCQQLLRTLALRVPLKEVADVMDMPVGSIGPTRARCLDKLRRTAAVSGLGEVLP